MFTKRVLGVAIIAFLTLGAFFSATVGAQSLYLSPDTVRVCSGDEEVFQVELRADAAVQDMNLYSVFLHFDTSLLALHYVTDTTFWKCLGWQVDSTCSDSTPTAWDVDSICLDEYCIEWEITDSTCLDSSAVWHIDTTCSEWYIIWQIDSTCTDSAVSEWRVDSICLNWQCTNWNEFNQCIDSVCLTWDIDSVALEYECLAWQIDSTIIDSICMQMDLDSTQTGWSCVFWEVDSLCLDTGCLTWSYDSTATAWGCTAWFLDSTCYDSVVSIPQNADFFTVDTIEYPVVEGPLMHPPQAQSVPFYSRLTSDLGKLIIESLIFWPRIGVDGPGLLATIKLKNVGHGIHVFSIDSIVVTDTAGNDLGAIGRGNVLILNPPPDSFNLLAPNNGAVIKVDIFDSVTFTWQRAAVHCPGDSVLYALTVSNTPTFDGIDTHVYSDLKDTFLTVHAISTLWYGAVYWKVNAYNTFGERLGNPSYRQFTLEILATPPAQFSLVSPRDDTLINITGKTVQRFQWTPSGTTIPNDTLKYEGHFWIGQATPGGEDFIVGGITASQADVNLSQFDLCDDYVWRIKCLNRYGLSTWSTETYGVLFFLRGDANGGGAVDLGDAVFIISYIFRGGPAPAFDRLADPNCDNGISLADAVYIISYIFKGGPAPCSD